MKTFVLLVALLAVVAAAPSSSSTSNGSNGGNSGNSGNGGNSGNSGKHPKHGILANMANAGATAANQAKKWFNGFAQFARTGVQDIGNAMVNAVQDGVVGAIKTGGALIGDKKAAKAAAKIANKIGTTLKTVGDTGLGALQTAATDAATLATRGVQAIANPMDGQNAVAQNSKYSAFGV